MEKIYSSNPKTWTWETLYFSRYGYIYVENVSECRLFFFSWYNIICMDRLDWMFEIYKLRTHIYTTHTHTHTPKSPWMPYYIPTSFFSLSLFGKELFAPISQTVEYVISIKPPYETPLWHPIGTYILINRKFSTTKLRTSRTEVAVQEWWVFFFFQVRLVVT